MAFEDLGSDISAGYDLDLSMRVVAGYRALAEKIIRRLTTDLGALPDFPSYGFNVENLIGTSQTESYIRQAILAQIFDEEEVQDATLKILFTGSTLEIKMVIVAGSAPFPLTINVSEVGVEAIIPNEV